MSVVELSLVTTVFFGKKSDGVSSNNTVIWSSRKRSFGNKTKTFQNI